MNNNINKLNNAIGLGTGTISDTSSLGGIVSGLLPYILIIAGLVLLAMLIMGGFNMLVGASNQESQEKGKKQITSALIGFFIIFASYWIAQALQVIFKIEILG